MTILCVKKSDLELHKMKEIELYQQRIKNELFFL